MQGWKGAGCAIITHQPGQVRTFFWSINQLIASHGYDSVGTHLPFAYLTCGVEIRI